jgi:hypothetical protein
MNRITVITLLSSITLLGCSTPQGRAAFECGAGSAAATYALCKLTGGKNDTCNKVALGSGLGGAAVCYTYASSLKARSSILAGRENDLDARLRYVRGLNEDAERLNAELRTRVAAVAQHTDEVIMKINQNKISLQQLNDEKSALDVEISAVNQQIVLERQALEDMKRFQASQARKSQALDAEIAKQESLLYESERQTSALAAQRQRV